MDDKNALDECLSGKERIKVDTFLTVVDAARQQLQSRFSDHNVSLMKQLSFFTPVGLLSSALDNVTSSDIRNICEQYGLCADQVHRELTDFRHTCKVCSQYPTTAFPSASETQHYDRGSCSVAADDGDELLFAKSECSQSIVATEFGEDDDEDDDDEFDGAEKRRWSGISFMKPLQLSGQLSGFPNLHMLYGIFSCLPVSSASAGRALSKLKIVKNRLRTSLSDATLASLRAMYWLRKRS
jgi:hypothetical protein